MEEDIVQELLLEKFKPGTVIKTTCSELPWYSEGITAGKEYTLVEVPFNNCLMFVDDEGEYNYACDLKDEIVYKQIMREYQWEVVEKESIVTTSSQHTSKAFLQQAINVQSERAKDYEQEGGERSVAKLAIAFNAITGHNLTEEDSWLFLQLLKDIRAWSTPYFHEDSALDSVSYAALKAEALARNKPKKGE